MATFLLACVALVAVQDWLAPSLRDPEYGRRAARMQARIAENPHRPSVLVLGSSRVSMGVRPEAWEEVRPEADAPMLLNMGAVGAGPVAQMLFLRRILAEGTLPDAILLEYWPPFLRGDKHFAEQHRIDPLRFGPADRNFVNDYYMKPEETFQAMRKARLNPFFNYRHRLLAQINPRFLRWSQRLDVAWDKLDAWGWLPGVADDPEGSKNRVLRMNICRPHYDKQFDGYHIDPLQHHTYRDLIALAKEHSIRVALLFLPESPEFRAWYPPEVERISQEHLSTLVRETGVPLLNLRTSMPDDATCDGFHLFRGGAAVFTQKLGREVMSTFPDLRRRGTP